MGVNSEQLDFTPAAFRFSPSDGVVSAAGSTTLLYGPTGADIVSATGAPVVDSLYAVPDWSAFGGFIDQIGFNVTAGGTAGAKARCGLYDADPVTLLPRNLLIDGGEFDATLVQQNMTSMSPPFKINRGQMYWRAFICGTAAPTVTTQTSGWHLLGRDATFGAQIGLRKAAQGYGALPAVFPASATGFTSNAALICVRWNSYSRTYRFGE